MNRTVDNDIKRVTVTLPKNQLDALQAIALREDVSVAWLIRKAVGKLLQQGVHVPGSGNPPLEERP
ncbi:CopG family transcriptional regulator [Cupriavidus sp. UYPR2.512]|uniref:ribbon-helix-helix domain-containing protein n=1 Tax=Cupriavidus sp. UYPR2.512 TaxID=1080187 RepID=UPI0009D99A1F|nr:CopG family transcriptional regulator [Cupriavidus sp. UYPR2.512]UIF88924.1 CopG family transcriptional regulator [Cupriavidus necator]